LEYDVPLAFQQLKTAPKFTIGSRLPESIYLKEEKEGSPGPNAYNPKLQSSGKAASLKGHHREYMGIFFIMVYILVLNNPGYIFANNVKVLPIIQLLLPFFLDLVIH
jgi:hypothetical protein